MAKVKMKTSELVLVLRAINMYQNLPDSMPIKLSHAMRINRKKLAPLGDANDETIKELFDRYADMDEKGEPIYEPGQTFPRVTVRSKEMNEEVKKFSDTEVEAEVHLIDLETFPTNFPAVIYAMLDPIIKSPAIKEEE